MAKRGRPRHPDILTPREWEVLALIREGLSNEQIAERLGTTERTARFHVSEILGKLGVSTRQEAAAWQPEQRPRRWWTVALAPLSFGRAHRWWMATALAGATITVGVAAIALLLWEIMRTHGESPAEVRSQTATATQATRACPTPGGAAQIDYVDFVKFAGISYMSQSYGSPAKPTLGRVFARVECRIADIGDASYRSQDGDAAHLAPGTLVYTVDGYDPKFRLAVRSGLSSSVTLYEAFANPQARTGRDLLDIDGKVKYIGVNSEVDGTTELAAIREPKQVDSLVPLVMSAPIEQTSTADDGDRYFMMFHLNDGTTVSRAYWPSSGTLAYNLVLPPEFRDAVLAALATSSP